MSPNPESHTPVPHNRSTICFFGAAPDTGNLGVSALCFSVLAALARRIPSACVTVFDHGRGIRSAVARADHSRFEYERCGAVNSRRFYRAENLWNIRITARLGGCTNPAAQRIRDADAVVDISGGDSFTDLYGRGRFNTVTLPKRIALAQGTPLILLPQTYGPYSHPRSLRLARQIVRAAAAAWARDQRSFQTLKELLGDAFDPQRHRCGVDVAFGLEAYEPGTPLPEPIVRWLNERTGRPTIGFNVSGLIFNDARAAAKRYGLVADYRRAVIDFLSRVLEQTDANVLLVPHVLVRPGHHESDFDACSAVAAALRPAGRRRVAVLPQQYDQSEMKWIIARTSWFCGTRMHSTIAGLSCGVPTAAISYSLKTQGVFETCRQGEHVADARSLDTAEVVERLWRSWTDRDNAREVLAASLPGIKHRAESQMDEIARACGAGATACPDGAPA